MAGIDVSTLSAADLDALLAQLRETKKVMRDADNSRLAELARPFVETILAEREAETSEKSGWTGIKAYSIPLVVDGVKVTFSATITLVEATEAGKVALKAAGETPTAEADEPEVAAEPVAEPEPASKK